jgi:hypothetical protein
MVFYEFTSRDIAEALEAARSPWSQASERG